MLLDKEARPQAIADEIGSPAVSLAFTFAGKTYFAQPDDTIGSALTRNGVRVLSRSFKYHRPRGLMCCSGHCPNCLVRVGDEMNVRACTRPVEPGMQVEPQNAWPSLGFDLMSLTRFVDRFLPVGFYYKAFIRPRFLWPLYEKLLRRAAGLGRVNPDAARRQQHKEYLHADVAVVGGGLSGLQAAVAAAGEGAHVLLFDENRTLGGSSRYLHPAALHLLRDEASLLPNLSIYTDATVLGWWEDNWLAAARRDCLFKIRAKAVVVATGGYDQPLVFANNDLPGVMLGSGVQRLLHLHGVAPGNRAVVVTSDDGGWTVAHDLLQAGVQVVGIVDARAQSDSPKVAEVMAQSAPVFWQHNIIAAEGENQVQSVIIAPLGRNPSGRSNRLTIPCDLVAVSGGWTPANGLLHQAGAQIAWDDDVQQFVVQSLPAGVFAAGSVTGRAQPDGRAVGQQAATHALGGAPDAPLPDPSPTSSLPPPPYSLLPTPYSLLPTPYSPLPPGKQFICFCEDVTTKDIETAVAEGYDSLELLKRYSTVSMGPCQGKMCAANAIHLCARLNGATVGETGVTTARPPISSTPLDVLAGPHMEPMQLTPVDAWHRQHGAKMMVAGQWMRPEHYGQPLAEARAVRQAVGLIDVSTLGKLRLTGPDAPALLDRLYINSWQTLGVGRARYGVMCNDEGVVLDDGVTARLSAQEWYTTTTSSGASAIFEWMQWWATLGTALATLGTALAQSGRGEGVHITDVTEQFAAFNLAGPRARAVLRKLTAADVSNEVFPYMSVRQIEIAGVMCRVLRIGFTGELSYEIHCPSASGLHVWQALMAAGQEFGIRPFGVEAQRLLRLEKAHIIIGQDTDAMSDPIAAGMAWAVKPDKTDFLGKRMISLVAASGPKQRLVGFKMATPGITPEEGLQIVRAGGGDRPQIIGWVTSSRFSPTLGESIGLCWLPADRAVQPGAAFTIWRQGKLLEARVHHGPFYDPEGVRLRM